MEGATDGDARKMVRCVVIVVVVVVVFCSRYGGTTSLVSPKVLEGPHGCESIFSPVNPTHAVCVAMVLTHSSRKKQSTR